MNMSSSSSRSNLLQTFLRHPKRDQYLVVTFGAAGVGLIAANQFLIYHLIQQDQAYNHVHNHNDNDKTVGVVQSIQNIANRQRDFTSWLWRKRKTVFAIGSFIVVVTGCFIIYLGWKASHTKTQFVLTTQFQRIAPPHAPPTIKMHGVWTVQYMNRTKHSSIIGARQLDPFQAPTQKQPRKIKHLTSL